MPQPKTPLEETLAEIFAVNPPRPFRLQIWIKPPPSPAGVASVTLVWNPSPGTNIAGYNVYFGVASRTYTNKVNVAPGGGPPTTNATISGLFPGVTYFFAVTAYDSNGLESDYSNEMSYTVPFVTAPGMPRVLFPPVTGTTGTNASGIGYRLEISWRSAAGSTPGGGPPSGGWTNWLGTNLTAVVSNLWHSNTYFFTAVATNSAGAGLSPVAQWRPPATNTASVTLDPTAPGGARILLASVTNDPGNNFWRLRRTGSNNAVLEALAGGHLSKSNQWSAVANLSLSWPVPTDRYSLGIVESNSWDLLKQYELPQ